MDAYHAGFVSEPMSLTPYKPNRSGLAAWSADFATELTYRAHYIYVWLSDVAPIVIKYWLMQLGRDGIDRLPLLSWETKQEIKRWLMTQFTS